MQEAPARPHPPPSPPLPRWAGADARVAASEADAAFGAGAALLALDQILRPAPPWLAAFRLRQALIAAAGAAAILGYREDRQALRDGAVS